MEESMTFKVFNEEGKEVECEALFTFESEETNKNYIVYTDNTKDDEGNIKVYAAIYHPEKEKNQEQMTLDPIESENEWTMIEQILEEIQKEAKNAMEEEDEQ